MTPEEAIVYLEEHQGRLCCNYGKTVWPDGTVTRHSWQYSADNTCVTAARTVVEAIRMHSESERNER